MNGITTPKTQNKLSINYAALLVISLISMGTHAGETGFTLNFLSNPNVDPKSKPSLIRTDQHQWQISSGCCTKSNVQMTGQTPWLMQDAWILGDQGWQLPEVVSIAGKDYYHMIIGSEADGFIQESYIEIGYTMDFSQAAGQPVNSPITWKWAENNYILCGNRTSCSKWLSASGGDSTVVNNGVASDVGNGMYPLQAPAGKDDGNGSGNPNKVLIRQKLVTNEMTQEYLKDFFSKKPIITQDIIAPDLISKLTIDMSNSDYSSSTAGSFSNTLELVGVSQFVKDAADFDHLADKQNSFVNAGRYIYTLGPAAIGGANGSYTYADGGFDIEAVDWSDYFDPSESNPWSYDIYKP